MLALMETYHKRTDTMQAHCGRITSDDTILVVILDETCSFEIDLKEARMMLFGYGSCPVYAGTGENQVISGYLYRFIRVF